MGTIQIFCNFQIQIKTVSAETIEELQKEVNLKDIARKNSIQICQCEVKTRQQSLLCALDKRIAFQSFLKCSNVRFSFREKFSEFSDVTLDGTVICPNDKSNQVNRLGVGCLKCSYNRLKICQYLNFN